MKNPPLQGKRLFLLDMDGTIYLDDTLFDGTLDFLNYVNQTGRKYLFLTNNSSRGVDAYIEKMARLGIAASASDFLTSTDAMIDYLDRHGYRGKRLYGFGTASFRKQLKDAGFSVTDRLEDGIDALISGFDRELTFSPGGAEHRLRCPGGAVTKGHLMVKGDLKNPLHGHGHIGTRIAVRHGKYVE